MLVASISNQPNVVAVWDPKRVDQTPIQLVGHLGRINHIHFNADGTRVLTAASDRTAMLWDAKSGKCLQVFGPHASLVIEDALLGDQRIVTSPRGSIAYVWDVADGTRHAELKGKAIYEKLTVSPDNRLVAGLDDNGHLALWRTDDGTLVQTLDNPRTVNERDFTPDGTVLFVGLETGLIIAYSTADGHELKRLSGHTTKIKDISFSGNGKRMVTTSTDGRTIAWNLDTLSALPTVDTQRRIWGGWLDEKGDRAATISDDGTILLWRPETGAVLRKSVLEGARPAQAQVFWRTA